MDYDLLGFRFDFYIDWARSSCKNQDLLASKCCHDARSCRAPAADLAQFVFDIYPKGEKISNLIYWKGMEATFSSVLSLILNPV